jgi:hypothetical protein
MKTNKLANVANNMNVKKRVTGKRLSKMRNGPDDKPSYKHRIITAEEFTEEERAALESYLPTHDREDLAKAVLYGFTNAPSFNTGPTLTAADVKASIDKFLTEVKKAPPANPWSNIQIHVSDLALNKTDRPRVIHVKRWFHTQGHHKRKQEQLNKEFGFVLEPGIFLVDPSALVDALFVTSHVQAPYLIVHPKLHAMVAQVIKSEDWTTLERLVNRKGRNLTDRDE